MVKHNTPTLDLVRNAGMSAEIMGWIAYILVPPAFLFNKGRPTYIIVWLIYLLLAIFMINAGRYLRWRTGRRYTSLLLFTTGVAAVPMIPAVLPIISVVQSFWGFVRYAQLTPEQRTQAIIKKPMPHSTTIQKVIAGIWTLGIVVALIYGLS